MEGYRHHHKERCGVTGEGVSERKVGELLAVLHHYQTHGDDSLKVDRDKLAYQICSGFKVILTPGCYGICRSASSPALFS